MSQLLKVIILGIVQGITEWLPVSSSGHLVIFQQLFGMEAPIVFDIMLHFGTLLVIFLVFWKDIGKILHDLIHVKSGSNTRMAWFIILGSVPTAIIGFALEGYFEQMFSSLLAVGIALLITGTLLFSTKFIKKTKKKMNNLDAILIGTLQGCSIAPGISRSGATISMGIFRGIDRETAARYSFLLAIPAILGAAIFKFSELQNMNMHYGYVLLGTLVSMAVGYFSLKWLLKLVINKKFHYFAWYCWALGIILVLL